MRWKPAKQSVATALRCSAVERAREAGVNSEVGAHADMTGSLLDKSGPLTAPYFWRIHVYAKNEQGMTFKQN